MIRLEFSLAVALFLLIFVNLVILFWMIGRQIQDKEGPSLNEKFVWFCSVCTYTYIDTKQDAFSICPRCGSYNKKSIDKSQGTSKIS